MAQPWTTVAWALGPRDRTTLPPQRRTGWPACLRRDLVSLGYRSGARHYGGPPALCPRLAAPGEGGPIPLPGHTRGDGH
jgi:hypothetical protein